MYDTLTTVCYVQDWEKKYLHENWSRVLDEDFEVDMVSCIKLRLKELLGKILISELNRI